MAMNSDRHNGLRWVRMALAGIGGLALLDAAVVEPGRLKVRGVDVPVEPHLDDLVGLRLAHLSDLHVGGIGWRPGVMARAVEALARERVDLIAMTGDLIGSRTGAHPAVRLLSSLRADVPRLAVLGNHDHVHGGAPLATLVRGMESLGIVLLRNQSRLLDLGGRRVWFVGVDDGYSARDDLALARQGLVPGDAPRVLLTHYPDVADRLKPGEFQLSLAGHSHCGQIRVPVLARLVYNGHARTRYGCGLYRVNGNPLHVSAGLGMSGLPFRFRNRPEVTILTFVPSPERRGRHLAAQIGLRDEAAGMPPLLTRP